MPVIGFLGLSVLALAIIRGRSDDATATKKNASSTPKLALGLLQLAPQLRRTEHDG
jgi:hypothetical protein